MTEWLRYLHSSLRFEPPPVPVDKNAAVLWSTIDFDKLTADFNLKDSMVVSDAVFAENWDFFDGDNETRLRNTLERGRDFLKTIDAGTALGAFSAASSSVDTAGDALTPMRKALELKSLEARLLASVGNYSEAYKRLVEVLALGKMCGDEVLLTHLVGTSLIAHGLRQLRWLASAPDLPLKLCQRLIDAADDARKSDAALVEAIKGELCLFLLPRIVAIPEANRGDELVRKLSPLYGCLDDGEPNEEAARAVKLLVGHPRPYSRAATIRMFSLHYLRNLPDVDLPWSEQLERKDAVFVDPDLKREAKAWPEQLRPSFAGDVTITADEAEKTRKALRDVSNPLGKMLVLDQFAPQESFLNPSMFLNVPCWYQYLTDFEATRAFLAIRYLTLLDGKAPGSLDAVVERKVLPEFPLDPFSGEPLHYAPERKLLWSVGPDGKDDGGIERPDDDRSLDEDDTRPWDVVYRLP